MGSTTGFKADQAWRQIREKRQYSYPFQFLADHILPVLILAVYLEILLGNVQPDAAYYFYGPPPRF